MRPRRWRAASTTLPHARVHPHAVPHERHPRVRFHDLRHSHATQLLAAGVHPKIAQERLGHSTIVTTLDLYSHVSDTMQTEVAAKIDAALGTA
jgi:integrase